MLYLLSQPAPLPSHSTIFTITQSIMDQEITIAWALPVNPAHLAPRLLAYAATKAAITTLRLGVQKTDDSRSIGRLPPELVEMIAISIRDNEFRRKSRRWINAQKCIANTCSPSHHYTEREINGIGAPTCPCCGERMGIEQSLDGTETEERHEQAQDMYIRNFGNLVLSKCKKVSQDLSSRWPYTR